MDMTFISMVIIITILVAYALGAYWGYQIGKTDGIQSGYKLGKYIGETSSRIFIKLVEEELAKSLKEPKAYILKKFTDDNCENGVEMDQIVEFCQLNNIDWDFCENLIENKDCLRFWKGDHKVDVVIYYTNEQCSMQGIPELEKSIGIINILKKEFEVG